jgi:hypothetical protein
MTRALDVANDLSTFQSKYNNGVFDSITLTNSTIDTTTTTNGTFTLSGNLKIPENYGIDFNNYGSEDSNSATTVGSNLLDDYEEGTFEATLEYDTNLTGTLGNITTTSGISGNYIKIGNQVFVKYTTLLQSSHTGGNNALLSSISLPFVSNGLAYFSIYGYNLYGRYLTTILNNADLTVSTVINNSELRFSANAGTTNGGSGFVVLTNTCHINVIYTTLD